ncbi:sensor domain-containing diguanylate cyclase [Pseudomonas sp. J452]|uniref:sensor domain-containing diguanylate cyclase n=1 Tax=Pseudomonas sp. J452 TaxID=2898441 RepID=UPI0021AD5036|nr:diguanylate cyclase [Pseudomonas sp. J452]UUY09601.1 sensor domain-containing diguanylate cyclase [Pseudomonas sp. J452]
MRLLSLLFCLLATLSCVAAPLELTDDRPAVRLTAQLEYLLPSQELDFVGASQAKGWRPLDGASSSLGFKTGTMWMRLAVDNRSSQSDWRLLLEWPVLDLIELRTFDPASGRWGPLFAAGDHLPLDAWPERSRQPLFPLLLAPGEGRWIYLRLHSEEILVAPMQLLTAEAFQRQELTQRTLFGLFFGAMLAVLLYNANLYLFAGGSSHVWYSLYLLGVVVYELSLSGFGVLHLWPQLGRPAGLIYFASASLSFLAATLFMRSFLRIPQYGGWVLWANNLLLVYWGVVLVLLLVLQRPQLLHSLGVFPVALLYCLVTLATAFSLWRRGNRSARLFAAAWGFLIICTTVHVAALLGMLPVNVLTLHIQTFGFFAEFILLSVALVDRVNGERAARMAAQNELIGEREARLASQQQLLDEQARLNEELELRVQARTVELQQSTRELAEANSVLTRLSNTDALTQLANRRHCDQQLAQQDNIRLAVLVLDIDHFKRINDGYGHPFGDRCIAAVAEVLRGGARRTGDLAARYGGEEFLLVLSDVDLAGATAMAERIRAEVAALDLQQRGVSVSLSVSIGLVHHDGQAPLRMQALIDAADQALYAAKESGRNRVCIAN